MCISSQFLKVHEWVTYYKIRKPERKKKRRVCVLSIQQLYCKKGLQDIPIGV